MVQRAPGGNMTIKFSDNFKFFFILMLSTLLLSGCGGGGGGGGGGGDNGGGGVASSAKEISDFSFKAILNGGSLLTRDVIGTIDEMNHRITLFMPDDITVTGLIATFLTTGTSLTVNGLAQVNSTTPNNFSNPVTFRVTAADGTYIDYTVKAMHWRHPASINDYIMTTAGINSMDPKVAMDNNGNAIIVWWMFFDSYGSLAKSEYRGGAWNDPEPDPFSPPGSYASISQEVAMDDNGNAIITWLQDDAIPNKRVFKSDYRGGVWTHPTGASDCLSTAGTDAGIPQVAMDNYGNSIIIWSEAGQLFKSEYRGGAWSTPASFETNTYAHHIAMDHAGNSIIVWSNSEPPFKLFKSEYRGGAWTHPGVSDYFNPSGYAFDSNVAMDNKGNAVIVWVQLNDGDTNRYIYKKEYRNGLWLPSTAISSASSDIGQPQVAMDDNDNAIIVWQQTDGSHRQIFKAEYRGGLWSLPTTISTAGTDFSIPQVAMDNSGNAVIVWQTEAIGYDTKVFKSEYRGNAWSTTPKVISPAGTTGTTARGPQVAMDHSGNSIITWFQDDDVVKVQAYKSEYR